tara:strand:+ start:706 stop:1869 length:1164 start_codon:yes stop_codon:yes gene_type:complete
MPKLLQINSVVNTGSTGKITEQIGVLAIKNGYDSYIAGARNFSKSKSKIIKISNKLSLLFHLIRTRILGNHLYGSKKSTKEFIKVIENIKPDIIHLHNLHGYYLNFPILFNYLKNIKTPIVFTMHDYWSFKLIPFNKYPKSFFIDKSQVELSMKENLFNQLDNIIITGVSKWIINQSNLSFFKNYKKKLISNGIDISLFKPRNNRNKILKKYNLSNENKYLIAVGTSWTKSKGLYDYINLSKSLPDFCKLILVGVNSLLRKKIPKEIIVISRTESQYELSELYSISELLLCLSYNESFGLTPVEAMACGTPSIVYDNTALKELVSKNIVESVETGRLDKVLIKIEKIIKNKKSFYYENCRNHAKNLYDYSYNYMKYIELYDKLLKKQ